MCQFFEKFPATFSHLFSSFLQWNFLTNEKPSRKCDYLWKGLEGSNYKIHFLLPRYYIFFKWKLISFYGFNPQKVFVFKIGESGWFFVKGIFCPNNPRQRSFVYFLSRCYCCFNSSAFLFLATTTFWNNDNNIMLF